MTSTKKSKRKSNKGFTIVETLCAMFIAILIYALMITGIQIASDNYMQSMRLSEAEILSSSLEIAIKDELRYCNSPEKVGSTFTYFSIARGQGQGCRLVSVDGEVYVRNTLNSDYQLLGGGSYTKNCKVELTETSYDPSTNKFVISYEIYYENDSNRFTIMTNSFEVESMNQH